MDFGIGDLVVFTSSGICGLVIGVDPPFLRRWLGNVKPLYVFTEDHVVYCLPSDMKVVSRMQE